MRAMVYAVHERAIRNPGPTARLSLRSVTPVSWRLGPPLGIPGLGEQREQIPEYQGIEFDTEDPSLFRADYLARDDDGHWFIAEVDSEGYIWALQPDGKTQIESFPAMRQ